MPLTRFPAIVTLLTLFVNGSTAVSAEALPTQPFLAANQDLKLLIDEMGGLEDCPDGASCCSTDRGCLVPCSAQCNQREGDAYCVCNLVISFCYCVPNNVAAAAGATTRPGDFGAS